ncbi:hypothetical protein MY11210_006786 [Beauveria gryllotalpidicola]
MAAGTIISVGAPSYVINLAHNSAFRSSEEPEYINDSFAAKSPAERSDNGTPAPMSLPPDITLAITTRHFPKDPSVGFVFGTDSDKCDILLPSSPALAISKRQFAITFHTRTGAVILRNLSRRPTKVLMKSNLQLIKLETQRAFCKEEMIVRFHGLRIELSRPWVDGNVPDCYAAFLARLAGADPNLGAMHLLSATESSTRSSISHGRSVYGSEVVIGSGASAIRHIINFHEFNVRDGVGAELIMEYAALGSMAHQGNLNKFTKEEACTIIKQTLQALQYLHGRRITHRDIKPANILIITRSPIYAKVADFGLSIEGDNHDTFCGTARYAAPEVRRPPYTAKVDIWSVGVMVMELWGMLPAKSDVSWAEKLVAHKAKQASNMTTELLDACLQLDPNNRATAAQCLELTFFHPRSDGKQDQTLVANQLDAKACATVVRVDNSIPDTAPCAISKNQPPCLPEPQGEEPCPADSKLVWNGQDFEPFLARGEGWPSDLQLQRWTFLRHQEEQPEESLAPIDHDIIPTWNPIDVENWVPGGIDNFQPNAEADGHQGAANLFPEQRGTELTHTAGPARVNVTHASNGTAKQTRIAELLLDRPGLARMIIAGKNVSMQIPGYRINASEVLDAAPITRGRRRTYLQTLKSHLTVDAVMQDKMTWVPFEDGVLLCEALGLKETLLPLLLHAGRNLPDPETNYLKLQTRTRRRAATPDGYEFLPWGNGEIPYKPAERLINATALLRVSELPQGSLRTFMAQAPKVTKVVLGRKGSAVHGTYVSYAAAETLCNYFGLDPTSVRDLAVTGEACDNWEAKGG